MPLRLEDELLLVLLVAATARAVIDLLLHHQGRFFIFRLPSKELVERGLTLDSCVSGSHSLSSSGIMHLLVTLIVLIHG